MNASVKPLPWSEKVRDKDSKERAAFLGSHVELVKYVAIRLSARLPTTVDVDDLVNDGILGLLDASEKFNPGRGVQFRTYAESRVRGAILDGLRSKDWRPRSLRHMQRRLDEAISVLSTEHSRPATEGEIAGKLGLDVQAYRTFLKDANAGQILSLEDMPLGQDPAVSTHDMPQAPLERKELMLALADELEQLPDRERQVIELYYHEGLNMKEVGAVLGVTESRVCQLHGQAAGRLRVAIGARLRPEPALAGSGSAGRRS